METQDIEEAVQNVRRYFDHDAAKQTLKEKYEAKMLFAAFGGMWKAGPGLISLLSIYSGLRETIVLPDEYGNPCEVNTKELFDLVSERYQEQMQGWIHEYTELQKQR